MITTFISEVVNDILKKSHSFKNTTIILPSQRARVFVKQELKNKMESGFLPEMLSIEQFVKKISKLEDIDTIELLFHFYSVYKKVENNPDTFDVFTSWATTVLQDFNEIDQHLIDSKDIFAYVRDIKRLRKWSVNGVFKETELIKEHQSFLERLFEYYTKLTYLLDEKSLGYQGMIYRKACERLESFLENKEEHQYYFVGFNALNKAEEFLIKEVLSKTDSQIYWDIDEAFLNNNHQAGKFIRKYKETWRFYEKNDFLIISNHFKREKEINIVAAAKNVSQIKYASEVLSKSTSFNKTALVLADETLMPVCINSLPSNLKDINITMGYPLKDIPSTSLIFSIFKLFLSQEKLSKKASNEFYHKDIVRFFNQPFLTKYIPNSHKFIETIARENKIFISYKEITHFIKKNAEEYVAVALTNLLEPIKNLELFIKSINDLLLVLKNNISPLEKEYLFRFYRIFNQLENLQNTYNYITDIETLFQFFKQLVGVESLSFQGEPLQGLQIMGMLETRVLDFEEVILVSANEGILPANVKQNSFIPFDVKTAFGLPTYREKDAIFSYHFFRLLQRASKVTIIYNSETDSFDKGEKSRFISQLERMLDGINFLQVSPKIVTSEKSLIEVNKNKLVQNRLKEIAKKGFSPSSITTYLKNPIDFYKQKILQIKEQDEVEETIAFNTLGNVVHKSLEELYKDFIGKYLKVKDIENMLVKYNDIVVSCFLKEIFSKNELQFGNNRLIFEVAKKFIQNFLHQEKELLSNEDNRLKILGLEQHLSATVKIKSLDFPIKIAGIVDRIDELNGVVRIIDYKTSKVESTNLHIKNLEILREEKTHKAIQVLIYAYLYFQNNKPLFNNKILHAGIVSFKNLNKGLLQVNYGVSAKNSDYEISEEKLLDFVEVLKTYIFEIFNNQLTFKEAEDTKY